MPSSQGLKLVTRDEDGVDTASEGEDPNRRVIIVPAGDAG